MRTQFHERVQAIVIAASRLPGDQRTAFIQRAAGDDELLRLEAKALLPHFAQLSECELKSPCGTTFSGGTTTFEEKLLGDTVEDEAGDQFKYIDQYRIEQIVGRGGMGVVYHGIHVTSGRPVAIKLLRGSLSRQEDRHRFAFEAEILRRLNHPGIAAMIHANMTESAFQSRPYFVMEYVRGIPLTHYAQKKGLTAREKLALMIRVCEVVEYAHQRGIIHLDLKPSNILVDGGGHPKILDFGISQVMSLPLPIHWEGNGPMACTPRYASPEQFGGSRGELTPKCDVYALGLICYELLTRELPTYASGRIVLKLSGLRLDDQPEDASERNRQFRYYLGCVLAKALRRTEGKRYCSAGALGADLETLESSFAPVSKWTSISNWFSANGKRSGKAGSDRWQKSSVADPLWTVLRTRLAASMDHISLNAKGDRIAVD